MKSIAINLHILLGLKGLHGQLLANLAVSQRSVQRTDKLHATLTGDEVHHIGKDEGCLAVQAQSLPAEHHLCILAGGEGVGAVQRGDELM